METSLEQGKPHKIELVSHSARAERLCKYNKTLADVFAFHFLQIPLRKEWIFFTQIRK